MKPVIIIFGATGDLTKKKLLPALESLYEKKTLVTDIIGFARRPWTNDEFYKHAGVKGKFRKQVSYLPSTFDNPGGYMQLKERIGDREAIFYLATAPAFFPVIAKHLHEQGLSTQGRIVIEKPFGIDIKSAQTLNDELCKYFPSKNILRLDHYLSKELVQNILTLRFANVYFEPALCKEFVDNIQITLSESIGVEERAGYYDNTGALKDMIQSHVLQVLAYLTMEKCEHLHYQKAQLLKKLRCRGIVRAQYEGGEGKKAYRDEPGVKPDSPTETYAALHLEIANTRWRGVPVYVRSGKRLNKTLGRVIVTFKHHSNRFKQERSNKLIIEIQPEEGVKAIFNLKQPGEKVLIQRELNYCYHCEFAYNTPVAYETLFLAAVEADLDYFTSWDEIRAAWKFIDKLPRTQLRYYKAGSKGPQSADELLTHNGHGWLD